MLSQNVQEVLHQAHLRWGRQKCKLKEHKEAVLAEESNDDAEESSGEMEVEAEEGDDCSQYVIASVAVLSLWSQVNSLPSVSSRLTERLGIFGRLLSAGCRWPFLFVDFLFR